MKTELTKRTQAEIVERIEQRSGEDPLGFETPDYMDYLDFEHAKNFLKEGTTEEQWNEAVAETKTPREAMIDYMKFAFGKAHGERGISANRSISHMIAWGWLESDVMGDEILKMYTENYHSYGLHILRRICEMLGIDPKEHGDCQ